MPVRLSLFVKTLGIVGAVLWLIVGISAVWALYLDVSQYGWEGGPYWIDLLYFIPFAGAAVSGSTFWLERRNRTGLAATLAGVSFVLAGVVNWIWLTVPVDG